VLPQTHLLLIADETRATAENDNRLDLEMQDKVRHPIERMIQ
jgi:hypothetical protein